MRAPAQPDAVPASTEAVDHLRESLRERYRRTRHKTETLCEPLVTEDFVVQTLPEVSPIKWHLAHTSWFFETFVLEPGLAGYSHLDPRYRELFNSYYVSVGPMWARDERGVLSRPTVTEILAYRRHVDEAMGRFLESAGAQTLQGLAPVIELGLNHCQQHQELILTDVKHVLSRNPLDPVYRERRAEEAATPNRPDPLRWIEVPEGLRTIGHRGGGFAFDNEGPRHRVFVEAFRLAHRLTTNGEYLEFMRDGGYARPELWLSDGWMARTAGEWRSPLYWSEANGVWREFTLSGLRPVDPAEPVCHVSYFEADAFARWKGVRLPTEAEWEVAAEDAPVRGSFVEAERYHPAPAVPGEGLTQLYGELWQWTGSPYTAYPGYRPPEGALGEYNGKFMSGQMVVRGASCATPASHARLTYRNFFPPQARWQFLGIRLAADLR